MVAVLETLSDLSKTVHSSHADWNEMWKLSHTVAGICFIIYPHA